MGPAPRAFPSWLTIPGYFWLAAGDDGIFSCLIFALNGLLYVIYNITNGHMRNFVYTETPPACLLCFFITFESAKKSPQESEYNPLQRWRIPASSSP